MTEEVKTETKPLPRAYLLVRTDLPSMGNGKGKAHSMHAGNHMTWELVVKPMASGAKPDEDVIRWHEEGGGFGTTIALGGPGEITLEVIDALVSMANAVGFKAGKVVDGTYPYLVNDEMLKLIDMSVHTDKPSRTRGGWVCFRKEVTAAWFLADPEKIKPLLGRYDLAPE